MKTKWNEPVHPIGDIESPSINQSESIGPVNVEVVSGTEELPQESSLDNQSLAVSIESNENVEETTPKIGLDNQGFQDVILEDLDDNNNNNNVPSSPEITVPKFDYLRKCVTVPRKVYENNRLYNFSNYHHILPKPLSVETALSKSQGRGYRYTDKNTIFEEADFYIRWRDDGYNIIYTISGHPVRTLQCEYVYGNSEWKVAQDQASIAVFENHHFNCYHLFRYDFNENTRNTR